MLCTLPGFNYYSPEPTFLLVARHRHERPATLINGETLVGYSACPTLSTASHAHVVADVDLAVIDMVDLRGEGAWAVRLRSSRTFAP